MLSCLIHLGAVTVVSLSLALTRLSLDAVLTPQTSQVDFRLVDSVQFEILPEMEYALHYYSNSRYYALDTRQRTILKFNARGGLVHTINRYGAGPDEYSSIAGFYPVGPDTMYIITKQAILAYNWKGQILKKHKLSEEVIITGGFNQVSYSGGIFFISAFDPQLSAQEMSFYEKSFNLIGINYHNGQIRRLGFYYPESIYRKYRFPVQMNPVHAVHGQDVYSLLPFDQILFKINSKDLSVQKIGLNPQHFGSIYYQDSEELTEQLLMLQKNAQHEALAVSKKYIFTDYEVARPDAFVFRDIQELNKNPYRAKRYWNIYSTSTGEKLTVTDIPAQTHHFAVLGFENDSTLLIRGAVPAADNDWQNYQVYVYRYVISMKD